MRIHVLALATAVLAASSVAAPAVARVPHPQFAPGVMKAWWLTRAPPTWRAAQRIQVRSDPKSNSPVTMILSRGEVFEAAARTEDGWVAVAEDGVVKGYVFHGVVSPVSRLSDAAD